LDVDFVGVGVRVLSRLGALVDRVGVGVFVADRVGVGVRVGVAVGAGVVRRGVYDGLVGRTGVLDASSTVVIGLSWLVTLLEPVCRTTNHPTPTSRTRADSDAISGPATPLPGDRLWFVMVCTFAQVSVYRPVRRCPLTNL
jgi:hypothetical protein